jgi:tagatose 1,6-diphosphate aldolase
MICWTLNRRILLILTGKGDSFFMTTISIGKTRGLQQCSTPEGAIAVLALDHRGNLRQALNPSAPEMVSGEQLTDFKQQVVGALAPFATAVLLDAEFGAAQCVASGTLPGKTGLVVSVEATGYTGDPTARHSRLMPGWSVAKAKRMGASAVKLLVYYHPDADTRGDIEALVQQTAQDCREQDMPLFLEPLSYSPDPAKKKLMPAERRRVVIETARSLTPLGGDVLKVEFPVDYQVDMDERAWAEACADLTAASCVPWVLLSASAEFNTFLRMVRVACLQGCTGVAVGRAVWQEATSLSGTEREQFLQEVARPRMKQITELCADLARPWTACFTPAVVDANWYQSY